MLQRKGQGGDWYGRVVGTGVLGQQPCGPAQSRTPSCAAFCVVPHGNPGCGTTCATRYVGTGEVSPFAQFPASLWTQVRADFVRDQGVWGCRGRVGKRVPRQRVHQPRGRDSGRWARGLDGWSRSGRLGDRSRSPPLLHPPNAFRNQANRRSDTVSLNCWTRWACYRSVVIPDAS